MGLLDLAASAVGLSGAPDGDAFTVPSRGADGPVLSWVGEDGKSVFIEIDCIPGFTDSKGGKVTDFALEDGSSISDHFIRNAQTIKLEVNQTQTPIENSGPKFEDSMELAQVTLVLPKNNFKPSGLLLATTAVGAVVSAGFSALGSAIGIQSGKPLKATILRSKTNADRINALYDGLDTAFAQVGQFTLTWLGRTWGPLVLEQIDYSRSAGRQLGVFSLSFKRITFVTTASAAALQIPAELTMKLPKIAGSAPGKALAGGAATSAGGAAVKSNPALEGSGI